MYEGSFVWCRLRSVLAMQAGEELILTRSAYSRIRHLFSHEFHERRMLANDSQKAKAPDIIPFAIDVGNSK